MWPLLVELPAYFTLLTLGFALALALTVRAARDLHLSRRSVIAMNVYMVLFGIVGARLLHVLADGHLRDYINLCVDPLRVPAPGALVTLCAESGECGADYVCDALKGVCRPPRDCLLALKLWRGGFAYYGGFVAASLFAVYRCQTWGRVQGRGQELGVRKFADLAAPAIMLGLFCGRIGCYLNGCCYGKPTGGLFGVRFPVGSMPWEAQLDGHLIAPGEPMLPVHPTQLYEALGCLLLFAFLYYVVRVRKRHEGQVYGAMLILYGVLRSVCEIFRDDERGVFFGGVSTSQLLSLPLIALGLWLVLQPRR